MQLSESQLIFLNLANQRVTKDGWGPGLSDASSFYVLSDDAVRGEIRQLLTAITREGSEVSKEMVFYLCLGIAESSIVPVLQELSRAAGSIADRAGWELQQKVSSWPTRRVKENWTSFPLAASVWRKPIDFVALLAGNWSQRENDFS